MTIGYLKEKALYALCASSANTYVWVKNATKAKENHPSAKSCLPAGRLSEAGIGKGTDASSAPVAAGKSTGLYRAANLTFINRCNISCVTSLKNAKMTPPGHKTNFSEYTPGVY